MWLVERPWCSSRTQRSIMQRSWKSCWPMHGQTRSQDCLREIPTRSFTLEVMPLRRREESPRQRRAQIRTAPRHSAMGLMGTEIALAMLAWSATTKVKRESAPTTMGIAPAINSSCGPAMSASAKSPAQLLQLPRQSPLKRQSPLRRQNPPQRPQGIALVFAIRPPTVLSSATCAVHARSVDQTRRVVVRISHDR